MSPDRDDEYLEDDAEDRRGKAALLAAGWLRAVLVLGALAVVLVITVPYILQWLSGPTPPGPRPALTESARTEPPKAEPPMAPPAATPAPSAAAVTPDAPAKTEAPAAKPESPSEPSSKPAAASTPSAKPQPKAAAGTAKSTLTPTTPGGDYWVQVGLFANGGNAERLAKELRDEHFSVEVAQTTKGGASATSPAKQHEVVVSGATVDAVTAALKGSGTAEAAGDTVVVRPAMDLKDAVALSRRLAGEGLEVRIRRVGGAPAGDGTTVYLVRVGGYPTREAAAAGKRELAGKGVGGFVTQGPAK